jgi:hypothetical protein
MMTLLSNKKYTILLLIGLLPVLWSCSYPYQFSGSGSLPSGITRLYVSVIENRTSEAGIEKYITDGLINEFIQRRKDVLSRQEEAEGILSGRIDNIQDTSIAHSSQSKSTQSRVILGLTLKLVDQKGKIIWAANGINANQAYNVTNDKTLTEQNKKNAIQILSKRLAEKVYNRMTDDF